VDKVALAQIFSEYFGFACQSFHRLLDIHHLSSGACAKSQLVADVPSVLSLTPQTKKNNNLRNTSLKHYRCMRLHGPGDDTDNE
jgi:hypothetical protein